MLYRIICLLNLAQFEITLPTLQSTFCNQKKYCFLAVNSILKNQKLLSFENQFK